MNDFPRQKLQEIVTQYGHSVYHDPKLCADVTLFATSVSIFVKMFGLTVLTFHSSIMQHLLSSVIAASMIYQVKHSLTLTE
jgi:hypothetical protein